jgi:probable HAF family extracellular repeat protein
MNAHKLNLVEIALALALVGVVAVLMPRSSLAVTQPVYTVVNLSDKEGGKRVARGLSTNGQVIGRTGSVLETGTRAAVWTNGVMRNLGTLPGGDYSAASKGNSRGQVVGSSNTADALRAFIWTDKGGMQDLGSLPGDSSSEALDINESGQVIGYSSGPDGMHAVLWGEKGIQNLGFLPGGDYSKAVSINRSGQVVGVSATTSGNHAFIWSSAEGMRDLGVLPGDESSEAVDVNDNGDVVGFSKGPDGMRAVLWSSGKVIRSLGTLPGGNFSKALDINNSGVVVGYSSSMSGTRAFVWTSSDGISDLNEMIPADSPFELLEALSINDKGRIVTVGKNTENAPAHGHSARHDNHQGPTSLFLLIPKS